MRFDEVVTELVHKYLIAGVDRAAGNDFAAPITNSRRDSKVSTQLLGRTINSELLMLADDPRPGEEKEKLLALNLQDLVVFGRDDVNVIAAAKNEFGNLLQNVWGLRRHRVTDNSVQRGLHRTGWNFEWLEKIGTNADRHHDCDQDHFAVLPPVRLPSHRNQ